jgi:hypothetical protein
MLRPAHLNELARGVTQFFNYDNQFERVTVDKPAVRCYPTQLYARGCLNTPIFDNRDQLTT